MSQPHLTPDVLQRAREIVGIEQAELSLGTRLAHVACLERQDAGAEQEQHHTERAHAIKDGVERATVLVAAECDPSERQRRNR